MSTRAQKSLNKQHKLVPTPNQIAKQQSFQIEKNKRRKPIKSLLQCEISISQLRPCINDLTDQNEKQCIPNLL